MAVGTPGAGACIIDGVALLGKKETSRRDICRGDYEKGGIYVSIQNILIAIGISSNLNKILQFTDKSSNLHDYIAIYRKSSNLHEYIAICKYTVVYCIFPVDSWGSLLII